MAAGRTKSIAAARKSIVKLLKLQSLVANFVVQDGVY
jgi:hypothetical protein